MATAARFGGFPDEGFRFYDGLAADNSRTYWHAHKAEFERSVRGPMLALLAELPGYGPFHVFRPNRDVRFSADKTPYKDHIGAYCESQGGAGFYVQMSASGIRIGAGYFEMAADQLQRHRDAIVADATGAALAKITADLQRKGYDLMAHGELKTAPRGYPKDHPRVELLRLKGLAAVRGFPPAAWMHGRGAIAKVLAGWEATAAMNDWLDTHVGPSTLPPDDLARFGPA